MKLNSFSFLFVLSSVFIILFFPDDVFAATSNSWGGFIVTQTVDDVSTDFNFSGNTFTWDTNGVTYRYGSGSPFPNLTNASTSDMFVIHNGSSSPIYSTKGVNFWLNQPCKGNDSMTFNFDVLFGLKDKFGNLNPKDLINPTFSTTCTSSWKSNNLLHVTCSVSGDSYIGTAVLFNSIVPKNQSYIYTIGIQNSISYTCQVGANSIITNNNINTDKIIDNQNKNQQQTNQKIDKIDDTLNDDNVTGSKDKFNSFFNDFQTDDFGLSGIITAPLSTIKSITSVTCSPLVLPLPFVNENLTLPCIRSIFEKHFSSLLLIYQTITTGILSYYIIVRLFNLVKDFKNPEHDEIEVMDL